MGCIDDLDALRRDPPLMVVGESLAERRLSLPAGLLNADGQACRQVHVRALTGADEEALFERGYASNAARVGAFLARAIDAIDGIDRPVDEALLSAMPLGDRDYLLLRLRQIELGDDVHQVMRCAHCRNKVDVDFTISELPVRRIADLQGAYPLTIGAHALRLRLPTGADQEAVEAIALQHPTAANTRLFARVVIEFDGRRPTEEDARQWTPAVRSALTVWLDTHSPGPDLYLDLACPTCNADISYVFDLPGFFLPNASVAWSA